MRRKVENEEEEEEQQGFENEAREKEKCFIILGDLLLLSGGTEGIKEIHTTLPCVACCWEGSTREQVEKKIRPLRILFHFVKLSLI